MLRSCELITFAKKQDERGVLVALEGESHEVPFSIERVYYISSVPSNCRRGFHAHKDLEQVLVCVCGSVSILVDDGYSQDTIVLSGCDKGLYIGPMVWREMFSFTEGAALVVLASKHYDAADYLSDYNEFKRLVVGAAAEEKEERE